MVDEEEEEEEGGQRRCLIHAKTKIGSISKIGNKGERLKAHENSEKHRKCQEQAVHFLAIASRKDTFVKEKLNKAYWNKVETNRHSLKTDHLSCLDLWTSKHTTSWKLGQGLRT